MKSGRHTALTARLQALRIFMILCVIACAAPFGSCASESKDDDSTEAQDDKRPVDDVEDIPGYLVDPALIKAAVAESETRVTAPAGAFEGEAASVVAFWSVPLGGDVVRTEEAVEITATFLAAEPIAADGSFDVGFPNIEPAHAVVCAVLPAAETYPLVVRPRHVDLPEGGATHTLSRLDGEPWTALEFDRVEELLAP